MPHEDISSRISQFVSSYLIGVTETYFSRMANLIRVRILIRHNHPAGQPQVLTVRRVTTDIKRVIPF